MYSPNRSRSPIELKCKLHFALVICPIAGRGDPAKCSRVGKVEGTRGSHHAGPGETRQSKLWRVGQVENLGSEFCSQVLPNRNLLEKRQVHAMEARAEDLTSLASQGRKPALTNLRDCSRIGKRCRIHPLVDIVLR